MKFSNALWTIGSLIGAQQAIKTVRGLEADDLLGLLGVQRRRTAVQTALPAIGLVALGAAVGAGAALLVAPMTGADLRQRLSERVDQLTDKLNELGENYGLHTGSNLSHESRA
jgi:hypothetical protein